MIRIYNENNSIQYALHVIPFLQPARIYCTQWSSNDGIYVYEFAHCSQPVSQHHFNTSGHHVTRQQHCYRHTLHTNGLDSLELVRFNIKCVYACVNECNMSINEHKNSKVCTFFPYSTPSSIDRRNLMTFSLLLNSN